MGKIIKRVSVINWGKFHQSLVGEMVDFNRYRHNPNDPRLPKGYEPYAGLSSRSFGESRLVTKAG
jgi:hypothetical protein